MGWFSWLIYFALFATTVKFTISALQMFLGTQYVYMGENFKDYIYSTYDGLEIIDIGYGVALLIFAAFTIFTRFKLAGFKKNGPFLLLSLYPAIIILDLIYVFMVNEVVGGDFDIESILPTIVVSAIVNFVMSLINFIYFRKRKSLFVN